MPAVRVASVHGCRSVRARIRSGSTAVVTPTSATPRLSGPVMPYSARPVASWRVRRTYTSAYPGSSRRPAGMTRRVTPSGVVCSQGWGVMSAMTASRAWRKSFTGVLRSGGVVVVVDAAGVVPQDHGSLSADVGGELVEEVARPVESRPGVHGGGDGLGRGGDGSGHRGLLSGLGPGCAAGTAPGREGQCQLAGAGR